MRFGGLRKFMQRDDGYELPNLLVWKVAYQLVLL